MDFDLLYSLPSVLSTCGWTVPYLASNVVGGYLTHCFISLDCCLLLSICVIFRCVLHPLPLPLSSCLGCIPPLIGLPSLRFYAVGSSLFLLSVCFCLCSLFYRDDVLCWLLLARPFLYAFHAHLRFPVDLVWFRLSCDHGWIRSGSVNVRKQQKNNNNCGAVVIF